MQLVSRRAPGRRAQRRSKNSTRACESYVYGVPPPSCPCSTKVGERKAFCTSSYMLASVLTRGFAELVAVEACSPLRAGGT
eukprot:3091186-Pyramimonas_sp.AAC.1